MAWAKLDDGLPDNPKILSVGLAARWAFISGLCYAGRRRDPHITLDSLKRVDATVRIAAELEAAGLWDRNDDGWVIHDWHEYQAPLSSTERTQKQRRAGQ